MICITSITQRNSVILMHFAVFEFSIEAIHRTVHFHPPALSSVALLFKASLAFLKFNIPDPLCFHGQQSSSPPSQIICFKFDPSGFFGFSLCDLARECMSSDARLNALAADAVNLLWHRVRPFCAAA